MGQMYVFLMVLSPARGRVCRCIPPLQAHNMMIKVLDHGPFLTPLWPFAAVSPFYTHLSRPLQNSRVQQESGWFMSVLLESLTVWAAPLGQLVFCSEASFFFLRSRLGEEVVTGLARAQCAETVAFTFGCNKQCAPPRLSQCHVPAPNPLCAIKFVSR